MTWLKALRDLRLHLDRAALVVIALAVGLAALVACLASYDILVRSLDEGYLATNPADAVLRTDVLDDATLAAVRADSGVSAAEVRGVLNGRIKAGPAQWRNLVLYVVPDFSQVRISRIEPQQGAWPPREGELLIERDAMQVAHARLGEEVTVRMRGAEDQTLRVSGTAKDVGQAQARMENLVYGYVAGVPSGEPRLYLRTREDPAQVSRRVKAVIESRGHLVKRVDLPPRGKHPHADLMGLLMLALAAGALFVLLLSGTLVANFVSAWMATQLRQIGVMKAIGASRSQIARIYLLQTMLLGGCAVLLAIAPGLLGARAISRAQSVFLNFDLVTLWPRPWIYAVVLLAGLAVPLLFAARPVRRGTAVPVRAALDDLGVSPVESVPLLISGPALPLLLAVRNAFRRRRRAISTLVPLTLAGLFFMTALDIRASLVRTLDNLFARRHFDLSFSLASFASQEQIDRALKSAPQVDNAELWIATEGSTTDAPVSAPATSGLHGGGAALSGDRFPVLALPPVTKMIDLQIARGRGFQPGDTDALIVNSALAAKFRVGSRVKLQMGPVTKEWEVIGMSREPFSPPVGYIVSPHAGAGNSLRVTVPRGDVEEARAALDKALEREGVQVVGSATKPEMRVGFDEHMRMIYVLLVVVAGILGVVGGLGLTTAMSIGVLERRRELGVLRAVGATPFTVGLLVVLEGGMLALLAWFLAALLSWPVSRVIGGGIVLHAFRSPMDFAFAGSGPVIWLIVSLLVGTAACLVPAWRASRSPVREALAWE